MLGVGTAQAGHPGRSGVQAFKDQIVTILAWIVLGLVAGFIASKLVVGSGQGVLVDILLGVVGAVVGGWLFQQFGGRGVTGFDIYSVLVAVVGAVVVLMLYHAIVGRRRLL